MFKKFSIAISLATLLLSCNDQHAGNHSTGDKKETDQPIVITHTKKDYTDTVKKSLPAIAKGNINGNRMTILYHSPAVRGRVIWGGLVAYDQVWVTGAHMATNLESKNDFSIGRKKIPAGKYAFFTIPGKEEWTIIINKNWEQHLADEYDPAMDVVRVTIKPRTAEHQERLMYIIDQTGERKCDIVMRWEKISIRVPLEISN